MASADPWRQRVAEEVLALRAAYAAFNARDIDAALVLMTNDVTWPKAFKGGYARGHEQIRAYWSEQWTEIDPHVEPAGFYPGDAGQVVVDVHQLVRNLEGAVLADVHVGHCFSFRDGLIRAMEICAVPAPASRD